VDEAFPGDVVGLVNPGLFTIGDTLSDGEPLRFDAVPRFEPECFATLYTRADGRYKQFHRGLAQLEEEGAIQVPASRRPTGRSPMSCISATAAERAGVKTPI
jgi:peptide chain release factor 3